MVIKTHKHSSKDTISVENTAKWHNVHFMLLILLLLLTGKDLKNLSLLDKKFGFFLFANANLCNLATLLTVCN